MCISPFQLNGKASQVIGGLWQAKQNLNHYDSPLIYDDLESLGDFLNRLETTDLGEVYPEGGDQLKG